MKKILSIILCSLFLLLPVVGVSVCGEENAKNSQICSSKCNISISGINSTMHASLEAIKSVSLKITVELQKSKSGTYTTIETWNATKQGTFLSFSEKRMINVLSDYRIKVTFTAGNETIVKYAYPQ